jgi:hypothetical protein
LNTPISKTKKSAYFQNNRESGSIKENLKGKRGREKVGKMDTKYGTL